MRCRYKVDDTEMPGFLYESFIHNRKCDLSARKEACIQKRLWKNLDELMGNCYIEHMPNSKENKAVTYRLKNKFGKLLYTDL